MSKDEFPKPLKIGRRALGWPEDVIGHWQQQLQHGHNDKTKCQIQDVES
jgi:predicted DNA-binding transcriptional regulator AlpA